MNGLHTRAALFGAGPYRCIELQAADALPLQRFFEANPEYFLQVGDQPPRPDEAQQEFDDLPPPHLTYRRRWMLGFIGADGGLVGMASTLSDLMAPGVGHIGLFIIASTLHGQGVAAQLHAALERWMAEDGWDPLESTCRHASLSIL